MTARDPLVERQWYRVGEWLVAIGALIALAYLFAVWRGWLAGNSPRGSSLLQLASSVSLLLSVLVRRRSLRMAIIVQAFAVALLVWSIARLGRGH